MLRLREPQMESDDNAAIDRGQREEERGVRRKRGRGNRDVQKGFDNADRELR